MIVKGKHSKAGRQFAAMFHLSALFALALAFFAMPAGAQTLTIYDDALLNGFDGPNYSYGGGFDFNNVTQHHTGTKSVSLLGHAFNALSFAHLSGGNLVTLHTADTPILRFWVNGGTASGQQFHVSLQIGAAGTAVGTAAALDGYINGGSVALGAWREVTIDLRAAPFNAVDFDRINIQSDTNNASTDASATYFDDIVLGQPNAQVTNPLVVVQNATVAGLTGDRFIWQDGNNKQREAMLSYNDGQVGPAGGRGGSLREFKYQLPNGATRTAGITTYPGDGDAGFGYVVMHASASNCLPGSDDSPIGGFQPGNGYERVFTGRHHAILRFRQNYPRNCDTTANPVARTVPVTIDWVFSTGHDNPLWAITYDVDQAAPAAVAGTFKDDSRAPYGELNIDGDGSADINGTSWGDRYKFIPTNAVGTPMNLNVTWAWNTVNTVPFVKEWIDGALGAGPGYNRDATMGIVQTQTLTQQDAGGARDPNVIQLDGTISDVRPYWTKTDADNVHSAGAAKVPTGDNWPYQANGNNLSAGGGSNNARLTWKTQYGFIGPTAYNLNNNVGTTAPGWPKKSYSTYIVLGTHSSDPVGTQLGQVETVQTLTFMPTIGTVVTSGPAGNVRADTVTYAPAGYNHVYGSLAFSAASNNLDVNIAVGAGTLRKPLIIVGNYTAAAAPQVVKLAGITLLADTDYFASVRASASQLWITLNKDLTGAANRLEITGAGGGLGTPTNVVATATSSSQVTISWTAVAGAAGYEVQRSVNIGAVNGGFATIATPAGTAYNNVGLTADTTYLYRVQAVNGAVTSGFSTIDPATTILFSDDPLDVGVAIKTTHMTQLRTAVNAMRAAGNLGAQEFTDPVLAAGSVIKTVHMTQLRTALDQARFRIGLDALVYIDPTMNAGVTTIKAAHVTGLRNGVK